MKIHELSEKELIAGIRKDFGIDSQEAVELGIGDDAAVIKSGEKKIVLTKDLLIEDVHFLFSYHPPALLGRKSLCINLSDIAAGGCTPKYALMGLGLPSKVKAEWVQEFFSGFKEASLEYNTALIGGDVTQADKVVISISLIGEGEKYIKRCGAKPGDLLFVSGTLGDSAQGLILSKQGIGLGEGLNTDFLLRAFFDPIPRVSLGKKLAELKLASAMIDISDGLSVDLGHICEESSIGAEIELNRIPISTELSSVRDNPLELALHGGEDYQLLFAVPPEKEKQVSNLFSKFKITKIGRIISGRDIFIKGKNGTRKLLEIKGYQHFA